MHEPDALPPPTIILDEDSMPPLDLDRPMHDVVEELDQACAKANRLYRNEDPAAAWACAKELSPAAQLTLLLGWQRRYAERLAADGSRIPKLRRRR